jgi:molecular chaperone DnaK
MLKDNAAKISSEQKEKIDEAAKAVREALKGTDVSALKSATEKLNEAWQAASADMYRAASEATKGPGAAGANPQPEPQQESAGPGAKEEGPIIEAEVVDEKK